MTRAGSKKHASREHTKTTRKKHVEQDWSEKKVNLSSAVIIGAVTLFIGLFVGLKWNDFSPYLFQNSTVKQKNDISWSSLNEVYNKLSAEYDGEIDKEALIEGAKKGLTAAIGDVYTVYMDAEEAAEFEADLHGDVGAGIGVEIALREGYVKVVRTLPDNPARKAGILAGDIIYKVDGEEVYMLSASEVADKVRGAAGTEVTVSVVRGDEELEFKMTREIINNVSAYVDYDGKTAIITVTRFDTDTGTMVQDFAKEFSDKKINKVILDLRGNGGGYVSAAKDLLSLWIDGDSILIQKSANSADDTTYAYHNKALLKGIKTIVLVNDTTASASEIVAGALQDYKLAKIIGTKTYGKGVVQSLFDLSNNSLLKVTTAHWYTPLGKSINNTGIIPDKEVENTYDDTNHGRDPQMDAAKKE